MGPLGAGGLEPCDSTAVGYPYSPEASSQALLACMGEGVGVLTCDPSAGPRRPERGEALVDLEGQLLILTLPPAFAEHPLGGCLLLVG